MSSGTPRFDTERAKAAAARIRYNEIRDALEQVSVRVDSKDRSFSIDLGVGGAILSVNLTTDAMRTTPQGLSQALLETINLGMKRIAEMTNEVVAPYLSSADLNLAAITTGRLPQRVEAPEKDDWVREIEAASRIPKRPLGQHARPVQRFVQQEDGGA